MTGPLTDLTAQEAEIISLLRGLPGPETQSRVIAHLKQVAFWIGMPRCQGGNEFRHAGMLVQMLVRIRAGAEHYCPRLG